jgi:glycosyltransferase involved in cell wall biosynthesis
MTRLKIAQVATSDASIRLLLLDHIQALAAAGHEVTAVCAPGPWVEDLRATGIEVETVAMRRELSPIKDSQTLRDLVRLFRKRRFDVVHSHTPKAGLLAPLAARLAGVPVVVHTIHGLLFHDRMPRLQQLIFWFPEKFTAALSHYLLSQSEEDMDVAVRRRLCPPTKIRYAGNGINAAKFCVCGGAARLRLRAQVGFSPHDFVVGSVGRLVAEKGFEELFAAAERLRASHSAIRFVVIGPQDTDQRDAIRPERLRRLSERGIVHFAGWQDGMADWYSMMDVFVLPSHREGLPRACMEASAAGLPVIASDIRGCREVVHHEKTGLLVPARDVAALAGAIEAVMNNPSQARRMGENGRRYIRERFSSAQVLARLCTFYEEIARTRRAARTQ